MRNAEHHRLWLSGLAVMLTTIVSYYAFARLAPITTLIIGLMSIVGLIIASWFHGCEKVGRQGSLHIPPYHMEPPMLEPVNGFRMNVTPATIELFLAVYGDEDRYPGDSQTDRRSDIRSAVSAARLLPADNGGVHLTFLRTDRRKDMDLLGFFEIYERNSEWEESPLQPRLGRLKTALPLLITKDQPAC